MLKAPFARLRLRKSLFGLAKFPLQRLRGNSEQATRSESAGRSATGSNRKPDEEGESGVLSQPSHSYWRALSPGCDGATGKSSILLTTKRASDPYLGVLTHHWKSGIAVVSTTVDTE